MNNDRKPKPFKMSFSKILEVIKSEITKIISFKIKKNKVLNQTEIIITGETKMTDGIVQKGKTKTKKPPALHPELKQFMEEQNKFNSDVKEFIEDQKKFNKQIQETNQAMLSSIQEILLRLQRVEKCPTIKKELDELE